MTINVNVSPDQLQQNSSECDDCDIGKENGNQLDVSEDENEKVSDTKKAASKEILEKGGGTKKEKSVSDSASDHQLILVQENLYVVKILVQGMDPIEVQVSPQELVQELHQLLKDRESTCHRTCFKLQFNGVTMDNFCELKNIEGLKEGSEIHLVEEPYSVREARIHVRHVRDLLHSLDNVDAHNGSDCSSLCYVNWVTDNEISSGETITCKSSSSSSDDISDGSLGTSLSPTPSVTINNSPKQENDRSSPETFEGSSKVSASNGDSQKKRRNQRSEQNNDIIDCTPPDYIMPGNKDRLLTPIHPTNSSVVKMFSCIKVLSMSMWNPPPGNRKLHGDLLYLYVATIEQKRFHITCNPRGFFVNQSDIETFNAKPAAGAQIHHSLIDLLNTLSPQFKKNFAILNRKRFNRHPFERIATPFQVNCWTAPIRPHQIDHVRAEDTFSSRLIVEEHLPGQQNTRDWNEELSGTRELSRLTLPDRLVRERAMFKVHSDFVSAATRGAVLCVDGNVMAINPGDARNMRMYIWNNIFFSLGFDVRDHYKDYGGHHAAFFAPSADLNGVKAYGSLDVEGLNVLGTAVVDYKGYRVTAQTIIPGILEREQEQSVVYGSIDFGKTIRTTDEFLQLLSKTTKAMHIVPHSIRDVKDQSVPLESSIECKGIHGNDKRHYILDLQKSFPPDVNFLPPVEPKDTKDSKDEDTPENLERKKKFSSWESKLSDECVKMGFPRSHRHRLLTHRPELVDAFVENRYRMFVCHCSTTIMALRDAYKLSSGEKDETSTPSIDSSVLAKLQADAVRSAAKHVGSYSESEFDIRFNPDIFSPDLNFDQSDEQVEKERVMIRDLAHFLVTKQIPLFIKDCMDHVTSLTDGTSLTKALHDKGIGMRYLGKIVPMMKGKPSLVHIHKIALLEVLLRSTKHVMRSYLQELDQTSIAAAIAHFFNCLLTTCSSLQPTRTDDHLFGGKKKKKLRGKKAAVSLATNNSSSATNPWYRLTPELLWQQILTESNDYYDFNIEGCSGIDDVIEMYGIQKISFLRRLCHVIGIQVQTRDYMFDSRSKPAFNEEDVLRLFPVVKHAPPIATDAGQFFASGQAKFQQGSIKEAFDLFTEALNLYTNVYGAVHINIATCYRQLARLHYMMSEHSEAISSQLKAAILSERCLGVDSPTVVADLMSLALYCFASQKLSASLRLLYRARYLILISYGSDHPDIALVDSNIGLVLHGVQEYDLSLKFLDEALKINEKYHGELSHKSALSHHLMARAHSCKGEFRLALNHEKETFKLYKALYGVKHEKTKESAECLRHLTEQAVTLQRTMNEIYKNGSAAAFPPLQITAPSMQSVLDLMNIINGIIFIPLSQKDLDNLRKEVMKQQGLKQKSSASATETQNSLKEASSTSAALENEAASSKDSVSLPVNDSVEIEATLD